MNQIVDQLAQENRQLKQINLALNQALEHHNITHSRQLNHHQAQLLRLQTKIATFYHLPFHNLTSKHKAVQCNSMSIHLKEKIMTLLRSLKNDNIPESSRLKILQFAESVLGVEGDQEEASKRATDGQEGREWSEEDVGLKKVSSFCN